MIITNHRNKLINSIVYFTKNTKYCGITKLMKLLYFLDFLHFKATAKSVTGSDFFAWDKGPVPKEVHDELSGTIKPDMAKAIKVTHIPDTNFIKISPKTKFVEDYFSTRELNLLNKISYIFLDAKSEDMVEVTHMPNEPWGITLRNRGQFAKIDYILAVDECQDSLSIEEAKDISNEISEVHKAFGVA